MWCAEAEVLVCCDVMLEVMSCCEHVVRFGMLGMTGESETDNATPACRKDANTC